MKIINMLLGVPLGVIMYLCYKITNSYFFAIVLFTVISKILTFPLSISVQKNSILMVKLQPELDKIKRIYAGDKDKIAEEQLKLYDDEKYSPITGLIPTLIQIPIILGLLNVIYNPLQHMLKLSSDIIAPFLETTYKLMGTTELGSAAQISVVQNLQTNPDAFASISAMGAEFSSAVDKIINFDMMFLGMDLSATPSIKNPNILWIVPLLSGVSALIMCMVQNKVNVLQRFQGKAAKLGMTVFLVIFSAYFAFIVPASIGLYWTIGNLLAIAIMFILNIMYNPRNSINYAQMDRHRAVQEQQSKIFKAKRKKDKITEKDYLKKIENYADKELIFYAESAGFYKYMGPYVEYILKNSDITVHYITSDLADPLLKRNDENLKVYYVGSETGLMSLMMKIESKIIVMTTPDLGKFYLKRSLVDKEIEYIFTDHAIASLHLGYREGALDHYDTIFCSGPNQAKEMRRTEQVYNLPKKTLVTTGYPLLDNMLSEYEKIKDEKNPRKKILIAPSWQVGNIFDLCLDEVLEPILNPDYDIILRPHPEYTKRFPEDMQAIIEKYPKEKYINLTIETDFAKTDSVFKSDLIITDWSSIAQEFSYTTKKPSIFINTPMKVLNSNYEMIDLVPMEISLRDQIGVSVDIEKLSSLDAIITDIFSKEAVYKERIEEVVAENTYNLGTSAAVGGDYIIGRIHARRFIL